MIRRISSSLPTFRSITLSDGLNIIVADKTETSSARNTRNGAGKSSLVEVINFVLGSNADPDSIFRIPVLSEHFFSLDLDLGENLLTVSRRGSEANRIYIVVENPYPSLGTRLKWDEDVERFYLTNSQWREVLGEIFFDLAKEVSGSPKKNRPSFRSLFSYFVRRHQDAGFHEAHKHFKNQATVDYQVNLSYLFRLDWRIAQEWQSVRDQEKSIDSLRSALKQGALGGEIIESSGKLRTQLTLAERERNDLRRHIEDFRVVEDHSRLEEEASELTRQINQLTDENTADSLLIRELRQNLETEQPPPKTDLERVYSQVGIELPGLAVGRFEAVARFHESVIQNRRSFLRGEIDAAEQRVTTRRQEQDGLDQRRSEVMRILQSSGALQQFSALQSELSKYEAEVANIQNKYEMARQLESKATELTMHRARLLTRLQHDLDERKSWLSNAILTFEGISEELYENPGSLTIEATENGPEFGTVIQAKRSVGKNSMQIFCFDMTLAILNANGRMPGFLVHDSHLFDGADERQIARALAIGAERAGKNRFQYIVTMNTDDLPAPSELPKDFSLQAYVNLAKLTDASEDGGLFGFRFD